MGLLTFPTHCSLAINASLSPFFIKTHFTTFCFSITSLALTSASALHAALSVKPTTSFLVVGYADESRLLLLMTSDVAIVVAVRGTIIPLIIDAPVTWNRTRGFV